MQDYAVDTSSLISLIRGDKGEDVDILLDALADGRVVLPPPVLVEAYSNRQTRSRMESLIGGIEYLETLDGYWHRASELRADILAKQLKAKTADTLIAQSCIDHDVSLITRDEDFKHFAQYGGLELAK